MKKRISNLDIENHKIIRNNVSFFLEKCATKYDRKGALLLDIAPQIYTGAKASFLKSKIFTLDINSSATVDYVADITKINKQISNNKFDFIVCTEVLEHTLNPFDACKEIYRIIKPKGYLFVSVPFNFRIHGPLPDCWRFTVHGLKQLLNEFKIIDLQELESKDRWLMPIHYTVVAQKL